MSRLHPVRAREVIRFLEALGFVQVRQKGSHKFFRHGDGRTATIPEHRGEDLGRGILAKYSATLECAPPSFWRGYPDSDDLISIWQDSRNMEQMRTFAPKLGNPSRDALR